jgi:hypothetical protein
VPETEQKSCIPFASPHMNVGWAMLVPSEDRDHISLMTAYFHSVTHPLGFGVYASIAHFAIALTRLIAVSEIGYNACGVERKFGMPATTVLLQNLTPKDSIPCRLLMQFHLPTLHNRSNSRYCLSHRISITG